MQDPYRSCHRFSYSSILVPILVYMYIHRKRTVILFIKLTPLSLLHTCVCIVQYNSTTVFSLARCIIKLDNPIVEGTPRCAG